MNMNDQNFGEFLQTKREQQKITLRQLAEKLDLSAPFLSDVEKGRRNSLDMDRLIMLRQILNLSDEEYE
ncbi:helix-turn-helix transcriptional regulator, partial [Ruminococcus sp.]|uniref:helix-turn-helix domain-containing protein n=1 Tax=Ruminococcus sp. TaxID=41978 RepID=UPI0025DB7CDC